MMWILAFLLYTLFSIGFSLIAYQITLLFHEDGVWVDVMFTWDGGIIVRVWMDGWMLQAKHLHEIGHARILYKELSRLVEEANDG